MKVVKIEEENLVPNIMACLITQYTIFERFFKCKEIQGKKYCIYLMSNRQYYKWAETIQHHRLA